MKNFKKNLCIIIGLLMVVLMANMIHAAQNIQEPSNLQDIAVTLISQEPDPAEPSKYVDLRFKFDNNGRGEAQNIDAEILPEYPFSLDPGVKTLKHVGTLQSLQRGDVGVIVKYRVRIDKNAVEGENEIKIRYRMNNGVWIVLDGYFIEIRTHDAVLAVKSVSLDKKSIEPGSGGKLSVVLENRADSVLRDINVKLMVSDLPLVPIGSINEKSIYQIDSKEKYTVDFNLLSTPGATSGVYQVPLKVSYSDKLGNRYLTNGTVGLVIGAEPDLSISLDSSEIYQSSKAGEIVVKVVNKGVTDIKFMNVKIIPQESFRLLSNEEVYIGNIDSDDYETAEFDIYIEKTGDSNIMVPLQIQYMDANNNDYKDQVELYVNLYSNSEAKKFGLKKGNGFVGNLIVVIIVVVGLIFYRRWKKRKKKKE